MDSNSSTHYGTQHNIKRRNLATEIKEHTSNHGKEDEKETNEPSKSTGQTRAKKLNEIQQTITQKYKRIANKTNQTNSRKRKAKLVNNYLILVENT